MSGYFNDMPNMSGYNKNRDFLNQYLQSKTASAYQPSENYEVSDWKIGSDAAPQVQQKVIEGSSGGLDAGQTATAGMSGAAVGSPMGAAIAAGGSIASQIIAQRAADARAQRERAANIEQTLGQNQQNAYNSILQSLGRAYR